VSEQVVVMDKVEILLLNEVGFIFVLEFTLGMEPRDRTGPPQCPSYRLGWPMTQTHVFGFEERPIFKSFFKSFPELVLLQLPRT
jgi:hypothetical protein